MKVSILISLIFINTVVAATAQDLSTYCGNKKIFFDNGNKDNFSLVIHCPYKEYNDIKALPKRIVDINNSYLINRVGRYFVNKIKFMSCYIVDFSDSSLVEHRSWLEVADRRVKFAFQYYFNVQKNMKYYFTTVYDSAGNLLSKHMLPSVNSNKNFYKLIDVCKATDIAEHDAIFKGTVFTISLQYADTINSFIWEARLNDAQSTMPGESIERNIVIDGNTGAVVNRIQQKIHSACDGNTPPFPKIKKVKSARLTGH